MNTDSLTGTTGTRVARSKSHRVVSSKKNQGVSNLIMMITNYTQKFIVAKYMYMAR